MTQNNEIKALLQLIDDPDEEVYQTVSERIFSIGRGIIPILEDHWEQEPNAEAQERIELLIHRLHFRELEADFRNWKLSSEHSLLEGAILVARYAYPEMNFEKTRSKIEKMRRNIWLEINPYLTPIEQINVMNSIFYNYYKQSGVELKYEDATNFLLPKMMETKNGNSLSNAVLYLILCEMLDISVRFIKIPRQFVLGYMKEESDISSKKITNKKIKFYIDPVNGMMYSQKDIDGYFQKINVPPAKFHYEPYTNTQLIQLLLEEVSKCYENSDHQFKKEELLMLAQLLSE